MKNKTHISNYKFVVLFQVIGVILLTLFYYNATLTNRTLVSIAAVFLLGIINYILSIRLIGDSKIYTIISMLYTIGTIEIFRLNYEYGLKNLMWFLIGVIFMYIAYMIIKNTNFYQKILPLYVVAILFLFIITLVFGVNKYGARNWIKIFNHLFQPVELIKILFVFQLASVGQYKGARHKMLNIINICLVFIYCGFLFLQRDLGSALILIITFVVYLYTFEKDRRYLYMTLGFLLIFGITGFIFMNHVRTRFIIWTNPFKFFNGKGYQTVTALTAIANGGLTGTGIGLGIPNIIPVNISDMILAAISEEMGILTVIAIILLFLIFSVYSLKKSGSIENEFNKIIAVMLPMIILVQFFVILFGTLNLIPLTGVTVPFVSYGGSSMVASFTMLGILQAALRYSDSDIKLISAEVCND